MSLIKTESVFVLPKEKTKMSLTKKTHCIQVYIRRHYTLVAALRPTLQYTPLFLPIRLLRSDRTYGTCRHFVASLGNVDIYGISHNFLEISQSL